MSIPAKDYGPNSISAREMAEGAGARVKRALPHPKLGFVDPFVLLDEFFVRAPAGFPDHRHGGFEIITYMLDGAFRHRDDAGNEALISKGGIQWIRAGSGITHAEMPGGPGLNHGLQLWVNLPRASKNLEPAYKEATAADLPVKRADGAEITTLAGEDSPIKTDRPMTYRYIDISPGGKYREDVPAGWTICLYIVDGELTEPAATSSTLVVMGGEMLLEAAQDGARLVVLAGAGTGESIEMFDGFVR